MRNCLRGVRYSKRGQEKNVELKETRGNSEKAETKEKSGEKTGEKSRLVTRSRGTSDNDSGLKVQAKK